MNKLDWKKCAEPNDKFPRCVQDRNKVAPIVMILVVGVVVNIVVLAIVTELAAIVSTA